MSLNRSARISSSGSSDKSGENSINNSPTVRRRLIPISDTTNTLSVTVSNACIRLEALNAALEQNYFEGNVESLGERDDSIMVETKPSKKIFAATKELKATLSGLLRGKENTLSTSGKEEIEQILTQALEALNKFDSVTLPFIHKPFTTGVNFTLALVLLGLVLAVVVTLFLVGFHVDFSYLPFAIGVGMIIFAPIGGWSINKLLDTRDRKEFTKKIMDLNFGPEGQEKEGIKTCVQRAVNELSNREIEQ